eukprot:760616-Hanusia_phi.AAC.1
MDHHYPPSLSTPIEPFKDPVLDCANSPMHFLGPNDLICTKNKCFLSDTHSLEPCHLSYRPPPGVHVRAMSSGRPPLPHPYSTSTSLPFLSSARPSESLDDALSFAFSSPQDLSDYLMTPDDSLLETPDLSVLRMPLWHQQTTWSNSMQTVARMNPIVARVVGETSEWLGSSRTRRRQYAREACQLCRQRKHRCDDSRPCERCMEFGEECVSQGGQRRGRKPKKSQVTHGRADKGAGKTTSEENYEDVHELSEGEK